MHFSWPLFQFFSNFNDSVSSGSWLVKVIIRFGSKKCIN